MTILHLPDRDGIDVEALVADRYLDDLLAAGDRCAEDAPADAALEPELRHAARILRSSLVRVHPSFRFEERLAGRLADLAAVHGAPAVAAGGGGRLVRFPGSGPAAVADPLTRDPLLAAVLAGYLDPADADAVDRATGAAPSRRPLIVGGAITSAALSIIGVALVAWRASRRAAHPAAGSMRRAARSAHARSARARSAHARRAARTAALAGIGLGGPA